MAALNQYLASDAPAGRRFPLEGLNFVDGAQVRQDPDGLLTTLAAILNDHPRAQISLEVVATGDGGQSQELARRRAEAAAKALVDSGISASRVRGLVVNRPAAGNATVDLVVLEK